MTDVTVIVCTRNRAGPLAKMLASLTEIQIPEGLAWEFLLIDNGSSDTTKEVALSFADRLPLRYVFEGKAGISNARNRGVDEAAGAYLVWADDDVELSPRWLVAYCEAFAASPEAAFFGGPVLPIFESPLPPWIEANFDLISNSVAQVDLGPEPFRFDETSIDLPYNANMAVKASAQRRHRYDPGLGRAPGQARLGEETMVLLAIIGDGAHGLWLPEASVRHHIPADRMTWEGIGVYARSAGATWAYLGEHGDSNPLGDPIDFNGRTLGGVPVWLYRKGLQHRAAFYWARLTGNARAAIHHWFRLHWFGGAVDYSKERQRTPRA